MQQATRPVAAAGPTAAQLDPRRASRHDNRLRYANYGKGVIFWNSDSDAEQYVNDFTQIVSTDIYWFTESDACVQSQGGELFGLARSLTAAECHRASNYGARSPGWALDAMDGDTNAGVELRRDRASVRQQHEREPQHCSRRDPGSGVALDHRRAPAGIIYFQHSFGGACVGDHHTIRSNCEGTRPMVTSVNAQIKCLATVLNSPSVTSGTFGHDTSRERPRMVKWDGCNFYVFAGARQRGRNGRPSRCPVWATQPRPCLVRGARSPSASGSFRTRSRIERGPHLPHRRRLTLRTLISCC